MGKSKKKRRKTVSYEADSLIRVGPDFQAQILQCNQDPVTQPPNENTQDILVWAPAAAVDEKLDEYILMAKDKHGYNEEQLPHKPISSLVNYYYVWKKETPTEDALVRLGRRLNRKRPRRH